MTIGVYFQCIAASIFGAMIHLFVIKIPQLKERARVANVKFSMSAYLADDWNTIAGNLATIALVLLGIHEWLNVYPAVKSFVVTIFGFIGFTGSAVALAFFGKFGKKINEIVDLKTDKADGKIGNTNDESTTTR